MSSPSSSSSSSSSYSITFVDGSIRLHAESGAPPPPLELLRQLTRASRAEATQVVDSAPAPIPISVPVPVPPITARVPVPSRTPSISTLPAPIQGPYPASLPPVVPPLPVQVEEHLNLKERSAYVKASNAIKRRAELQEVEDALDEDEDEGDAAVPTSFKGVLRVWYQQDDIRFIKVNGVLMVNVGSVMISRNSPSPPDWKIKHLEVRYKSHNGERSDQNYLNFVSIPDLQTYMLQAPCHPRVNMAKCKQVIELVPRAEAEGSDNFLAHQRKGTRKSRPVEEEDADEDSDDDDDEEQKEEEVEDKVEEDKPKLTSVGVRGVWYQEGDFRFIKENGVLMVAVASLLSSRGGRAPPSWKTVHREVQYRRRDRGIRHSFLHFVSLANLQLYIQSPLQSCVDIVKCQRALTLVPLAEAEGSQDFISTRESRKKPKVVKAESEAEVEAKT